MIPGKGMSVGGVGPLMGQPLCRRELFVTFPVHLLEEGSDGETANDLGGESFTLVFSS